MNEPLLVNIKVLLLEDDAATQVLIKRFLRKHGAEIRSHYITETAYEDLRDFHPDVLVCDIGLPGEDGYSFMKKVRAMEFCAAIPAIALTAYAMEQDWDKAIEAGYHLHIAKPFNGEELVRSIHRLISPS